MPKEIWSSILAKVLSPIHQELYIDVKQEIERGICFSRIPLPCSSGYAPIRVVQRLVPSAYEPHID